MIANKTPSVTIAPGPESGKEPSVARFALPTQNWAFALSSKKMEAELMSSAGTDMKNVPKNVLPPNGSIFFAGLCDDHSINSESCGGTEPHSEVSEYGPPLLELNPVFG